MDLCPLIFLEQDGGHTVGCRQGGHWSGKSQGILQIGQGNFKYQKSQGISKFWPKICVVAGILTAWNVKKVLTFSLAHFAGSKLWKLVNFRTFCAKKLFKDFSELVKGLCHLSAARRQIGRKTAVFWSVKNWIWSGKSQWKVREFCFCMRVATLCRVNT